MLRRGNAGCGGGVGAAVGEEGIGVISSLGMVTVGVTVTIGVGMEVGSGSGSVKTVHATQSGA